MKTLLMRLAGPMQSWGTQSQFRERDTGLEPSKSGVVGLLCAALGMPRTETDILYGGRSVRLADLASLWMGVRVEREGTLRRDYQTAGGWHRRADAGYGVAKADGKPGGTVLSDRYYLADADFLVGLSGEDDARIETLAAALAAPRWPLCLGRKAFVPALPVRLPDNPIWGGPGVRDGDAESLLRAMPWLGGRWERDVPPDQLRLVCEVRPGDEARRHGAPVSRRQDVPVSFAHGQRSFGMRDVWTDFIETDRLPPLLQKGEHDVSLETDARSA